MMRRRGFAFGRTNASPNIPPALQHAHELMESGEFQEAAQAFEALAQAAEKRMGPRAPFLFIQAGHARIQLRQNSAGMAHIRHGLDLLASGGRYHQLYRAGNRTMQELKARGMEKEAQEIAGLISNHIPAISESPTQQGPHDSRLRLPTHCPACGGPVRADEVEWIDAHSAECPFCGSPVRTEQ
jgi:hypothetical protein